MSIFAKKNRQKQEMQQQNSNMHLEQRQMQQVIQGQQMQQNVREEVHREAAGVDMAVGEEQSSKKKTEKNIVARTKEKQHGSFSDVRRNAFQNNLSENINMDINEIRKENSEEYAAVLRDLGAYAQMEQNGRNFLEEGIALNNVREKLLQVQNINNNKLLEMNGQKPELAADKQVQQRKQIIEKEQKVLQRYSLYFDTFCMGQLKVEGAGPLKKKYDYRDKELNATDNTKAIFQMKDVSNIPLFTHEPSINDIHQKYLGDCYLEAALGSLVSEHPERVKELMKDNGDGTVTVCLYKNYTSIKDLPEKLSPQLRQARKSSQKKNFKTMSNYDIMLQLFGRFKGTGDEHYALEKKRQEDTSEELKRINDEKKRLFEESENPNLGEEERVTLQDKLIKLSKKEVDEILRCGKAAEAAVEKYFSIFNYSNSVFNSFEDIDRIASKMAGDDRFEPICKAVREMEQDNEKGLNEAVC